MRWLYYVIPVVVIAIPIIILSFDSNYKLSLKERLELYRINIGVSITNKTDNICNDDITRYDEVLDLIRGVDTSEGNDYGLGTYIEPHTAYELITNMKFKHIPQDYQHIEGYKYIIEPFGLFTCTIIYNENYYEITITPEAFVIPEDESYKIIKITNKNMDNTKIITLKPESVDVWYPFNNNILFVNELDSKIRVRIFADQIYDSFSILPHSIVGKKIISNDMIIGYTNQTIFTYEIMRYNLEGSIIVNRYPQCMEKEEAKMLFGIVGVEIIFPKYLPEGYEYKCTIHVLNTIASSYYKEIGELNNEESNNKLHHEKDGIIITTIKHLSTKRYDAEEWYEYVKKYYNHNAILIKVNDKIIVGYSQRITKDYQPNILDVYYNNHTYKIESKLSMNELIKIAESL